MEIGCGYSTWLELAPNRVTGGIKPCVSLTRELIIYCTFFNFRNTPFETSKHTRIKLAQYRIENVALMNTIIYLHDSQKQGISP
jgi:hypothetical protein